MPTPTATPTPTPTPNPVLLGVTSVQPTTDGDGPGQAEAFSYTASGTGTAHTAKLYLASGNSAGQVLLGVYSDSGGAPGALLGSATFNSPAGGAWASASVSVNLTAGTRYWLAILQPANAAGSLAFRDGGSGNSRGSSQTNLTSLPATYSAGPTWSSGQISAYLTS